MTAKNERPRVLVVDDDRPTRLLMRKILTQAGFAVDVAEGGAQALELAMKGEYGAVLLDLVMPQPDGFAVLRHLKTSAPALLDKVIIITAYPQQAVSVNTYAILAKPVELTEVIRLTKRCLGEN